MSNHFASPATDWAEVRVQDRVMRYRRAGTGRPLILLGLAAEAGALWPGLSGALAEDHRVLVPEVPPGGVDFPAWLGDLLEGLGVHGVALVAAGSLCVPTVEYVLLDPDVVSALALMPAGSAAGAPVDGFLGSRDRAGTVPLLVLNSEPPDRRALDRLRRFLRPA